MNKMQRKAEKCDTCTKHRLRSKDDDKVYYIDDDNDGNDGKKDNIVDSW